MGKTTAYTVIIKRTNGNYERVTENAETDAAAKQLAEKHHIHPKADDTVISVTPYKPEDDDPFSPALIKLILESGQ